MRVDAEKDGIARMSTGDNDDRITPVGRVIRACRMDELPQLFNILAGSMSVVGPRPERPEIAAQYEHEIPEFQLRLQAKAGLTGYAQVYGKYNTTPYDKLQMDLMYIANPSLIEDLKIIFATLKILPSFSWSEDVDETLVDALMEDIIKGGNFQAHGQQRPFAGVLTDVYNVDEISKTSTMHSYFQYIRTRISYDYPWAKSRLWLAVFGLFFPARWIVRMLLGKRRKFSITQAVQSARQREQLLRKLKLFK